MRTHRLGQLVACLLAVALAGCAATPGSRTVAGPGTPTTPSSGSPGVQQTVIPAPPATAASTAAELADCTVDTLATVTPGVITFATSAPLSPPWFAEAGPPIADGYEAGVATAVGRVLGFPDDRQAWQIIDAATAAGQAGRSFDVYLHQVGENGWGPSTVDYSSGYYSVTDAVLMSSAAAGTTPNLSALRVGALAGSSGESALAERGVAAVPGFDTAAAAVAALTAGSVDAVVLPTPDAINAAAADPALAVVGQLPAGRWQPEQFHLVLARDSPLTACVSGAVDRLRVEGTLQQLTDEWVNPLAPMLK